MVFGRSVDNAICGRTNIGTIFRNMTLDDYVDVICMKMHRTDDASRAEARTYVRARYRTICEAAPWRDLTEVGALPLGGSQETILPHIVGTVIACRWSTNLMLQNDSLWTVPQ
jgi:hypothetical protein